MIQLGPKIIGPITRPLPGGAKHWRCDSRDKTRELDLRIQRQNSQAERVIGVNSDRSLLNMRVVRLNRSNHPRPLSYLSRMRRVVPLMGSDGGVVVG